MARLAGNLGALPPDVVDEIVERTDGVPLFVEELTKAVVEAGADRGYASMSACRRRRSQSLPPCTPRCWGASIGWAPRPRMWRRSAPPSGATFPMSCCQRPCRSPSPNCRRPAPPRRSGPRLPTRRAPVAEYLFKHALVQDTAYSTLLRGPRQALHRRIAEALAQRFPDFVETRPEILAHHYAKPRSPTKRSPIGTSRGTSSGAQSAVREAIAQLRRGLSLLDGLPETRERQQLELNIHVTLTAALMAGEGLRRPRSRCSAGASENGWWPRPRQSGPRCISPCSTGFGSLTRTLGRLRRARARADILSSPNRNPRPARSFGHIPPSLNL